MAKNTKNKGETCPGTNGAKSNLKGTKYNDAFIVMVFSASIIHKNEIYAKYMNEKYCDFMYVKKTNNRMFALMEYSF